MSSNNRIYIIKIGRKYNVYLNSCVDNLFIFSKEDLLKTEESLIKAVKFAKNYCIENSVEYGYSIDDSCLKESEVKK